MLSVYSKLIALVAALLAAAPPGACCWAISATSASSSAKRASCCEAKGASHKQSPQRAPANPHAPQVACCCQQPVTEQAKVSVERTDGLVVSLPAISPAAPPALYLARAIDAPREDAGPPLNVLHCVWRC